MRLFYLRSTAQTNLQEHPRPGSVEQYPLVCPSLGGCECDSMLECLDLAHSAWKLTDTKRKAQDRPVLRRPIAPKAKRSRTRINTKRRASSLPVSTTLSWVCGCACEYLRACMHALDVRVSSMWVGGCGCEPLCLCGVLFFLPSQTFGSGSHTDEC